MNSRFDSAQPGYDDTIVQPHLRTVQCGPAQNAPGREPRGDPKKIEVMKCLDLEACGQQFSFESGSRVPPMVIECFVKRAEDRWYCGDEKEQSSVTDKHTLRGPQEFVIALNMLQYVDRNHCIDGNLVGYVFQITVMNPDAGIVTEPSTQHRDIVPGWLDQKQLSWRGLAKKELGDRSDAGARFNDSLAKGPGEGIDDPSIVVGGFGNCVQLGAGVRKCVDTRTLRSGTRRI